MKHVHNTRAQSKLSRSKFPHLPREGPTNRNLL